MCFPINFSVKEWGQNRGVFNVAAILGQMAPFLFAVNLEWRDAGHGGDQHGHERRAQNRQVLPKLERETALDGALRVMGKWKALPPLVECRRGGYVQTEPKQDLAKVVRVPWNAPQAGWDEGVLVWRVAAELRLLMVGYYFNGKACEPNGPANEVLGF